MNVHINNSNIHTYQSVWSSLFRKTDINIDVHHALYILQYDRRDPIDRTQMTQSCMSSIHRAYIRCTAGSKVPINI